MSAAVMRNPETNRGEALIEAALALQDDIRSRRGEIEAQRRVPLDLIEKLKTAGFFRMTMPKDWGGMELDPMTQLRAIEILAEADASVAWCVMIGSDTGYFSAFIDQDVAKAMFPDVDMITGSTLTTTGHAEIVDSGYHVSGRMPFSSGCEHSDWFVVGCLVYRDGEQCFHDSGIPVTRQCFVPRHAVTILDTWDTIGLRGSGSHDLEIAGHFVPEAQSFSFQDFKPYRMSPLYVFPMSILLNFSSVPLGIASSVIDGFAERSHRPARKTMINGQMTPPKNQCDDFFVQDAIGRAAAKLASARAYLYSTIEGFWQTLNSGAEPQPEQAAHFYLVHTHVFESCKEAIELVYKISGGGAVYKKNQIERSLRDIQTINQHVINSLRSYSVGGRLLLGLPAEEILL
ncbi:MAG: acyl-CoA dehydrogenase family protein [Wenzhouxiangellaceae bacterium]